MMIEQTLVLIKPDSVRRRMVGQIITAIEHLGLCIQELHKKELSRDEAESLYREHMGKWHFNRNIRHITSGPVVVVHVRGEEALKKCRNLVETFREAHKDLIRLPENLVHATSDAEKVEQELLSVSSYVSV